MILQKNEIEFLKESNAIEGVFDEVSLDQAKQAWNYLKEQDELSLPIIKQTHKILMTLQDLEEKYKGEFRDIIVYVGGYEAFNPYDVIPLLERWLADTNNLISLAGTEGIPNQYFGDVKRNHVDFERIHPFVDGNGRVGRMLMNWIFLKMGMDLLILKASERQEYYEWFGTPTNLNKNE